MYFNDSIWVFQCCMNVIRIFHLQKTNQNLKYFTRMFWFKKLIMLCRAAKGMLIQWFSTVGLTLAFRKKTHRFERKRDFICWYILLYTLNGQAEAHLEPSEASKMEPLAKKTPTYVSDWILNRPLGLLSTLSKGRFKDTVKVLPECRFFFRS